MEVIRTLAGGVAWIVTIIVAALYLPGLYAFMMIVEGMTNPQIVLFIVANILVVLVAFQIRIFLGLLTIAAWPIIIFQIYANFFYG